jgi:hypothetical protein
LIAGRWKPTQCGNYWQVYLPDVLHPLKDFVDVIGLLEVSKVDRTSLHWFGWWRERSRAMHRVMHDRETRGVLFMPVPVKEKTGAELHSFE